jgi:alpha-mannosidase
MTDWDGMRDTGMHHFDYALVAYDAPLRDSSVVVDADTYNAQLLCAQGEVSLPEMPVVEADNVRVASIKMAETGTALIMRLLEYRGRDGQVRLKVPCRFGAVSRVNLLERDATPCEVVAGEVALHLRPFEIATVRIEMI